ncbi:MAG: hypothetical protein ACRDFY_09655 [Candidatus Limnocylindria bacterium]
MSDKADLRDLERRIPAALHAAAPRAAPDLADRLLSRTRVEPQRRGWGGGLALVSALGAAAVVVFAIVIGLGIGNLLPSDRQPGVVDPSTSPATPSASESASPEPSPTPTQPAELSCENEALGYRVSYPADWFPNEEVVPPDDGLDPVPACQYFGEAPMEIAPNAGVPPSVAIGFSRQPQAPPPGTGDTVLTAEEVTVAGRPATVRELEASDQAAPFFQAGDRIYQYTVSLASGEFLVVSTDSTRDGDYEAHKAVLDAMMLTLELLDA